MTGEIDLNEEYQTKHDTYFIRPCKQRGHHSAHLVHGGRKSHQPCLFLWWKIEGQVLLRNLSAPHSAESPF